MKSSQKGALWRRWDLHVHSPESIEQGYGGTGSWPDFIKTLEALPNDVKVIGITDYYFLDGYKRLVKEWKKGKLTNLENIFPILEFRIDTFASASESKLQKVNLLNSLFGLYKMISRKLFCNDDSFPRFDLRFNIRLLTYVFFDKLDA